eukprot:3267699-Lingulodinium_polyedra.AAC.1
MRRRTRNARRNERCARGLKANGRDILRAATARGQNGAAAAAQGTGPVSYTHLTLPTICSV